MERKVRGASALYFSSRNGVGIHLRTVGLLILKFHYANQELQSGERMKISNLALLLAILLSPSAFAGAQCTFQTISGNHEASPCGGVFTVPNNAAMSSEITCAGNGYVITVDCDFTTRQKKLALSIVGPRGNKDFTNTHNSLSLVDENGDGASVSCKIQ
jgi:hypothetical protein